MKLLNDYVIDIGKLELGQHQFNFEVKDEFFELFEYSLVNRGDLLVLLNLEKKSTFLNLSYHIEGSIELVCDRSLDLYDYDIKTEDKLILKFGEEEKELTDEIEVIPFNTQKINVSRHIYEFISVSIPMKKLHPRYMDETPDDQMIYTSAKDQEVEEEPDPRWSELKKLKKK
jgi:uncharacterized metal-binding protein YceD (DUF177 family)